MKTHKLNLSQQKGKKEDKTLSNLSSGSKRSQMHTDTILREAPQEADDLLSADNKPKTVYIQCGYEDRCKNKDCLNCPRRRRYSLSLTLAEEIAVEDFAVADLKSLIEEKEKEVELLQQVMYKLMQKIFKQQR